MAIRILRSKAAYLYLCLYSISLLVHFCFWDDVLMIVLLVLLVLYNMMYSAQLFYILDNMLYLFWCKLNLKSRALPVLVSILLSLPCENSVSAWSGLMLPI